MQSMAANRSLIPLSIGRSLAFEDAIVIAIVCLLYSIIRCSLAKSYARALVGRSRTNRNAVQYVFGLDVCHDPFLLVTFMQRHSFVSPSPFPFATPSVTPFVAFALSSRVPLTGVLALPLPLPFVL